MSDIDTGVVDSLKALDPDGRLEKRTLPALFMSTRPKTIKRSSEYPQLQGTWHCVLPLSEGQRWQRSVDIELRKYGVHDNEYRIRGEFPVWGNGEGLPSPIPTT